MKRRIAFYGALALALLLPLAAIAQVHVRGYTKKDGTYVAPHYRSSPNSTRADNYSTRGNVNPYTGQPGTKDPYAPEPYKPYSPYSQPQPSAYGSSQQADPYEGDDTSSDGDDDGG